MNKQVTINVDTGVITYSNVEDSNIPIEVVKNDKINEINIAYSNNTGTIVSYALGTPHTYPADNTAMNKFTAQYIYVNGTTYGGELIKCLTLESGGVDHTKEQFCQMWEDGHRYLQQMFDKWDRLIKQINACTTVEEVQNINW